MALDEAIATIAAGEAGGPTIRVYGWRPPAVSIGYFQNVLETVNFRKCARLGIPLVRRLTGGRAVLHDQEVTYSVIATGAQLGVGTSVLQIYRLIGPCLAAALRHLGIDAQLSRSARASILHRATVGRDPCFSSVGRYEVVVDGRKIVGSAQRWLGEVVLQHGSLLTGDGYQDIAHLLPGDSSAEGERAIRELKAKTVSLGALLSRQITYAEVAGALFDGFAETLKSPLRMAQLLPREEDLAHKLVRERYGQQEWTLRQPGRKWA